jgi:transposase
MGWDLLAMSGEERARSAVMRALAEGQLSQREAAERLEVCVRHVKRLVRAWRMDGDAGLVSRQRGRVSPRRLGSEAEATIVELLRGTYQGFGPTLAAEKLRERDAITISRERLRQLQIKHKLWRPKRRRAKRVFQVRERRPRFGELIQIDGSPHDWFEGRGPRCTLIVFIDDATGRLTALHFAPAETTRAYLLALREHVLAHGVPLAFYSDRHGIFRVNAKDAMSGDGKTEFGRVAERLDIEPIHALTPQAKGRVERANQTLQDRLVKEMRLAGISDIAQAQTFLPGFIKSWNAKFAVASLDPADAHRPWTQTAHALEATLAKHDERVLSKALTFSADGTLYCVKTKDAGIALRGARITLRHCLDGTLHVTHKTRILDVTAFRTLPKPDPAEDEKTIDARIEAVIRARHPTPHKPTAMDKAGSATAPSIARSARFTHSLPSPKRGHSHFAQIGDILTLR